MTAETSLLAEYAQQLGVALSLEQFALFARLREELLVWNRHSNLTAITDPTDITIKHFYDSLTIVPLLRADSRVLDIGSGAGFPALPLKIALPELSMVTVDAVQKKILFQRHIIRTLGLQKMTAEHSRIEMLPEKYAHAFDVIVSRAFSALTDFVQLALPYLAPAGQIIAMKGKDGRAEAEALACAGLGVRLHEISEFSLPAGAGERSLIVLKKVNSD